MRARKQESARLAPDPASDPYKRWSRRAGARRYAGQFLGNAGDDPLVQLLAAGLGPDSRVLDVGSGPGRFALPLARRAREVVAVDESQAMLDVLRRECRRQGIANVRLVAGRWEEVEVEPADVAFCTYVLPLVEDAVPFLEKLDRTVGDRVVIGMAAVPSDSFFDSLWRHFHGSPRKPSPTWLDAVEVLGELGIRPDVEIVEVPSYARYSTLAEAVARFREQLVLPDSAEVRRELRKVLCWWLSEDGDGALRPPVRSAAAAALSWSPSESRRAGASERRAGGRRARATPAG